MEVVCDVGRAGCTEDKSGIVRGVRLHAGEDTHPFDVRWPDQRGITETGVHPEMNRTAETAVCNNKLSEIASIRDGKPIVPPAPCIGII